MVNFLIAIAGISGIFAVWYGDMSVNARLEHKNKKADFYDKVCMVTGGIAIILFLIISYMGW